MTKFSIILLILLFGQSCGKSPQKSSGDYLDNPRIKKLDEVIATSMIKQNSPATDCVKYEEYKILKKLEKKQFFLYIIANAHIFEESRLLMKHPKIQKNSQFIKEILQTFDLNKRLETFPPKFDYYYIQTFFFKEKLLDEEYIKNAQG